MISTNAGGLPEIIQNGYCGYMSNIGDTEDMASNAIKILENEALFKTFKKNALEQAKHFSIQNIVPQYEALYNKLV